MASTPRRTTVVNTFGTLGYLSVIMQWLWLIVIVAHPLLSSDFSLFLPSHDTATPPAPIIGTPSPLIVSIVIAVTIVIFAMTFYVLWKLPKNIGTRGALVTKRAATAIVPVITHHKKISKKRFARISYRVIILIKLMLIVIPVIGLLFAQPIDGLDTRAIWAVGLFCGLCSLTYIGAQRLLASLLGVKTDDLW